MSVCDSVGFNLSYNCGSSVYVRDTRQIMAPYLATQERVLWCLSCYLVFHRTSIGVVRMPLLAADAFASAVALWSRRYYFHFGLKLSSFLFVAACVSIFSYPSVSRLPILSMWASWYIFIFFWGTISIFFLSFCNV